MSQANPELPELDEHDQDHASGILAIWHDPTMYDPLVDGPPYLPPRRNSTVTASQKNADDASVLALLAQILQRFVADLGGSPMAELAAVLAFLRAESTIHQSHHWQTRGSTFYGDHLLYERLYNDVQGLIDPLAERTVGSGSHLLVNPVNTITHTAVLVQTLYGGVPGNPSPDDLAIVSLRMVLRFLAFQKMVYLILEKRGQLTHGTDNLLQGIADKHEEHVYLLKQRTDSYDRRA